MRQTQKGLMGKRGFEYHRRTGEIVRALFEIVMRQQGIKSSQVLDQLEAQMHLNDAEIRRATWGTTGATKVGWFKKQPPGRWTVTAEGERAFAQFSDPEAFHRELDRLYREWSQDQGESGK